MARVLKTVVISRCFNESRKLHARALSASDVWNVMTEVSQ